jgi:crotonobetainyl-CoA:carnitine CoA-transferase CaiB-like acyl-CoA transferase
MIDHSLAASCLPDPTAEHERLLRSLPDRVDLGDAGLEPAATGDPADACAVLAFARSGLMNLTGPEAGPPLAPVAPVLRRAEAMTAAVAALAGRRGAPVRLALGRLLTERAALSGFRRRGTASANGSCQLLPAPDGWLAVSLARPADVASLPAALGRELPPGSVPFSAIRAEAATGSAADLAARLQLLGVPASVLGRDQPDAVRYLRVGESGATGSGFVLDLSAMWAGPLCASILHRSGWQVLKVEDIRRPDGARSGPAAFYARLHAGIAAVRLDFGSPGGRAELLRLADRAAIIVESSRPRALRALGLVAEEWLQAAAGRVWISITGYGRGDPQQRVAFGDDAAVAGGLVAYLPDRTPVFCGDAIADPLTGLQAGLAALAASAVGGGLLADVAMSGVCGAMVSSPSGPAVPHRIERTGQGWAVYHGERGELVRPP